MNKQKGSILSLVLVFGSIFLMVLGALFGYIMMQYRNNRRISAKEQALHIAESGIEYYRWYLAHALEGASDVEQDEFWAGGGTIGYPESYQGEFKDQYGTVIGYFQLNITPPLPGGNNVIIESTGWTEKFPDAKRTVRLRRRRPSWGEYTVLINHRANLPSGMTIYGKAHSNEDLRVDGVIHNLATASETTHPDPITEEEVEPGAWTTLDPSSVFLGGRESGVPIVDFNVLTGKFNDMKELTEETNYYLDPPIKSCWPYDWFCLIKDWNPAGWIIELKDNGTIDIFKAKGWSFLGSYLPSYTGTEFIGTFPWPEKRLIFSEATVWIKGSVGANQITVGAANLSGADLPEKNDMTDIIIQDDILYTDSTASVGLIAQDNIMIDKNAGNPDLEVNAALVAKEGSVGREDFGDSLGTLTINGSISANYLADFGSEYCFFLWCWAGGFENVNLNYDDNLLLNPPPYFPTKEIFQTDMWEEID